MLLRPLLTKTLRQLQFPQPREEIKLQRLQVRPPNNKLIVRNLRPLGDKALRVRNRHQVNRKAKNKPRAVSLQGNQLLEVQTLEAILAATLLLGAVLHLNRLLELNYSK
jgi:hypothetical protein